MSMWSGKTGKKGTERAAFPLPSSLPLYFRVHTFLTICLGIGDFNLPSPVKATSKSHDQHLARASAFWELRRSLWPTTVAAKPKTSRQPKTKYLTAKPKTSRQKQKPHGKTKYFTAKTKYLTAKANTHGKTKAILLLLWSIWFCREVFCFCREVFCFCREVFGFAVRFLVLPWQLWATIKNSTFCYYIWYFRQHFSWRKKPTGNSRNPIRVYCSLFEFAGCLKLPFSRHQFCTLPLKVGHNECYTNEWIARHRQRRGERHH